KVLITDGAHNFHDAYMKEFWTIKYGRTKHIQDIRMGSIPHNNKMERMNGEIRDREKVMRSLKKPDTPILTGYQIYHNYIRRHMALDGQTPADKAGIEIKGEDKWLTLIQNAGYQIFNVDVYLICVILVVTGYLLNRIASRAQRHLLTDLRRI